MDWVLQETKWRVEKARPKMVNDVKVRRASPIVVETFVLILWMNVPIVLQSYDKILRELNCC